MDSKNVFGNVWTCSCGCDVLLVIPKGHGMYGTFKAYVHGHGPRSAVSFDRYVEDGFADEPVRTEKFETLESDDVLIESEKTWAEVEAEFADPRNRITEKMYPVLPREEELDALIDQLFEPGT